MVSTCDSACSVVIHTVQQYSAVLIPAVGSQKRNVGVGAWEGPSIIRFPRVCDK